MKETKDIKEIWKDNQTYYDKLEIRVRYNELTHKLKDVRDCIQKIKRVRKSKSLLTSEHREIINLIIKIFEVM
jgi:hypothetical protein